MQKTITWLSRHRTINILLATAYFLAVVGFHDEVTLLAIQLRRKVSIEGYNLFFSIATLAGASVWIIYLINRVKLSGNYKPLLFFLAPTLLLTIALFFYGLTFTIEAIHFFQYALLALLLFPLLKSYGATVFWATLLGAINEIYQYVILTPTFKYFDLNDILLNLLGAGLAVVTLYLITEFRTPPRQLRKMLKICLIVASGLAIAFSLAWFRNLITWYPAMGEYEAGWFSISRSGPSATFWTEAYKGKYFHIIGPWEGMLMMMSLFAFYFLLDRSQKVRLFEGNT